MRVTLKISNNVYKAISKYIDAWKDDLYVKTGKVGQFETDHRFPPSSKYLINSKDNLFYIIKDDIRYMKTINHEVSTVTYIGRRHALHQAQSLSIFEDLKDMKVIEYDSMRIDAAWWEKDLDHPKISHLKKVFRTISLELPEDLKYDDKNHRYYIKNINKIWKIPSLAYRKASACGEFL